MKDMSEGASITRAEKFGSIFLVGLLCLMLELIQVRMLSFFLGSISNFLAIPIALLGLAIGSLLRHFFFKGDSRKLISLLSVLVFPAMVVVFFVFFSVANGFFDNIHIHLQNPWRDAGKLLIYGAIFLPPYMLFGALLASYFTEGADEIGRLYFFDLAGAAVGCFITPLLFTHTDLPPVIATLLFISLLLTLNTSVAHKKYISAFCIVVFVFVEALVFSGVAFKEHPDPVTLSRTLFKGMNSRGVEEVYFRWNDIARTSLLRGDTKDKTSRRDKFTIVQDDGVSNVGMRYYDASQTREDILSEGYWQSIPFEMNLEPKNILVMFAGAGSDMVLIDRAASGKARITGVEINPAVVGMTTNPIAYRMNMHTFVRKPNINLVVREGRDFLNHDSEKYDYIFVASNGAVDANRIGHTRKYLDTYEATLSYMNRLTDDGIIIFSRQPNEMRVASLRKIASERGVKNFEKKIFMYGSERHTDWDSSVFKPSGLTKEDVASIERLLSRRKKVPRTLYSPYGRQVDRIKKIIQGSPEDLEAIILTDDEPFLRKIDYRNFTFFPSKEQLQDRVYASDWVKIFTVLLFAFISFLVILAVRFLGKRQARLPAPWLMYFLVSGIAYMCIEIGLMAKMELFLGSPLYAVAVILAIFLIANGVGAYLQDKYGTMRGPKTLVFFTTISVLWALLLATFCNTYLLSVFFPLKLVMVAITVFPAGTVLGMYYPFGVSRLVGDGYRESVPATYAIATLSSVAGSSFAMTVIVNVGFSTIVMAGLVGYIVVAGIYLAASKIVSPLSS